MSEDAAPTHKQMTPLEASILVALRDDNEVLEAIRATERSNSRRSSARTSSSSSSSSSQGTMTIHSDDIDVESRSVSLSPPPSSPHRHSHRRKRHHTSSRSKTKPPAAVAAHQQQHTPTLDERIANLMALLRTTESAEYSDAFDDEDRQLIKSTMIRLDDERKNMSNVNSKLTQALTTMTQVLDKRKVVLGGADVVLVNEPSVLEFMAVKQAQLEEKRDKLKKLVAFT